MHKNSIEARLRVCHVWCRYNEYTDVYVPEHVGGLIR